MLLFDCGQKERDFWNKKVDSVSVPRRLPELEVDTIFLAGLSFLPNLFLNFLSHLGVLAKKKLGRFPTLTEKFAA